MIPDTYTSLPLWGATVISDLHHKIWQAQEWWLEVVGMQMLATWRSESPAQRCGGVGNEVDGLDIVCWVGSDCCG